MAGISKSREIDGNWTAYSPGDKSARRTAADATRQGNAAGANADESPRARTSCKRDETKGREAAMAAACERRAESTVRLMSRGAGRGSIHESRSAPHTDSITGVAGNGRGCAVREVAKSAALLAAAPSLRGAAQTKGRGIIDERKTKRGIQNGTRDRPLACH